MSDLELLSVEDRLARLEQRLGVVAPLVLVPPIQIGSLSNVPAPGAQIAAQWAQDVTGLGVHRFANVAARDAAYAPAAAGNGAACITLDTQTVWISNGTTWQKLMTVGGAYYQMTMTRSVAASNTSLIGTGQFNLVPTINMPATPAGSLLDISAMVYFSQSALGTGGTQVFFTDSNSTSAAAVGAILSIEDRVQGQSYALRHVGYVPPTNVAYPINLRAQKLGVSNPTNAFLATHTVLSVIAYKP
jgi:hypothetical protein